MLFVLAALLIKHHQVQNITEFSLAIMNTTGALSGTRTCFFFISLHAVQSFDIY